MRLVLVHGWGFHAGLWREMMAHLPDAEITAVDLGFLSGGPRGVTDWPPDAIAVGHSLGLLWLLREGGRRFRGLVSIQGFDCFSCHVSRSRVEAMRRGLRHDAPAMMHAFWTACGIEDFASPEALDLARLEEGLSWLADWDARQAKAALRCPMLALAAKDDAIVSEAMSQAIWSGREIEWSPDGGHVLPLKRPGWCARHVRDFADAIGA